MARPTANSPTADSPARDKLRCGALAAVVVIVVVAARARAAGSVPPVVSTQGMASTFDAVIGIGSVVVLATCLLLMASYRRTVKAPVAAAAPLKPADKRTGRWLSRRVVIGVFAGVLFALAMVVLSHPDEARTLLPPSMSPLHLDTPSGGVRSPGPRSDPGDGVKIVLLILVLATAGVLIAVVLRRNVAAGEPEELSQEQTMARAVEAGRQAVLDRSANTPREAIVACFVAMEHALAGRGGTLAPRISDTPSEVLQRGIERASLPAEASRSLLRLFREAQFSTHPMTEQDRVDADGSLGELLGALGTAGGRGHR